MNVRFSILIPVYNREGYVRQAVDSVLSQTFTNFELITIDDGSTDSSAEILKSYGSRITFLQQTNQGPEAARNKAATLARGEYILFLDSDDYFLPFALDTLDQIIRYFESPPLILTNMIFQEGDQPIDSRCLVPGRIKAYKYKDFFSKTHTVGISASCIVIRKSTLEEIGGLRKDSSPVKFHSDDTNLLLKAGTYSPCIIIDQPCTVVYRKHAGNSVRNFQDVCDGLLRLAQAERRGEYPDSRRARTYIGRRAASFAYGKCWREGDRKLGIRLVIQTAPLVAAALWSTALGFFRKPTGATILPTESKV
jgi:glycosyltransferase involved in cell wall biosynthesis